MQNLGALPKKQLKILQILKSALSYGLFTRACTKINYPTLLTLFLFYGSMKMSASINSTSRRRIGLALLAVITLGLGACASGVNPDGSASSKSASGSLQPWNDPSNPLYKKSVYFDFDSYTVKPGDQAILETHANYLKANKSQKIVVQGNTDDIGTTEYNLALGQRRSDAVRKVLNLLGVSDAQIEAVSFGKEKPKAMGTDDASRAENRRADIVY